MQEFTFEAKSEVNASWLGALASHWASDQAQLAEIEKAVRHVMSVVGDVQPEEPSYQPSAASSSLHQENTMAQEMGAVTEAHPRRVLTAVFCSSQPRTTCIGRP